jgi:hypothetical protein
LIILSVFKDGKDSQVRLAEWKEGTLLIPPLQWYHQHFNNGKVPARFVKLGGWNNDLYPFTTTLVSESRARRYRLSG